MGKLNFRDIGDDWTPSAISIVDSPDHPLAVFEVYEDDEEFVMKSLNLEVDTMRDNTEQMVSGPVSFFEKIFGKNNNEVVVKSEGITTPLEPPAKPSQKGNDNEVLEAIKKLDEKIDKMDERVSKLEESEGNTDCDEGETTGEEPAEGVVTKSQEDSTPSQGESNNNDPTQTVVTKSREVDPDGITVTKSEKTRYERMGRNSKGMTW